MTMGAVGLARGMARAAGRGIRPAWDGVPRQYTKALWLLPSLCSLWLSGPAAARAAPDGVEALCRQLSRRLASVDPADCLPRPWAQVEARSRAGRPLLRMDYGPVAGRRPRARVLVVGGIHGDELTSVSIVFRWMRVLDRHHSGLFHWRMVPVLNPDGLLRRPARRMNARGVDLNRNFPTPDWRRAARRYWVERTRRNPRRYPGPAPLSEPESRWLAALIHRFRPDAIVAVHAPHGILDYDGPPEPPNRLGHLHKHLLGTYPGSLGNYAGLQLGIPVLTLELASAGRMPSPHRQRWLWRDMVRWLRDRLPRRHTVGLQAGPS